LETSKITYQIKKAKEEQIYSHLKECNTNFFPPLSDRVNLEEYSKKIADKAITFEAWSENTLVGLIAAYMNEETKISFITNVSVLKNYMGLGIAAELTKNCIEHIRQHNFKEIKLEVHKNNLSAISLYKKFNFTTYDSVDNQDMMKLEIE
jgi:ribosomal protein S18 acetylase RimI-like enzyme